MDKVGQIERKTQNRVVKRFVDELGYEYLGNWETDRENKNIESEILHASLKKRGYADYYFAKTVHILSQAAGNQNRTLYENNKEVYSLLRYGVKVKANVGDNFETVELIDWKNPSNNHFAIAEEVTVFGQHEKRPDIVIYVNGIALGVLELKRSTVSIGDGIRQSIVNQQKEFIQSFFSTIQFIFAGNDTEGLRYGAIGTEEKFFLKWKEDSPEENLLDKYLLKLCNKERFLEIIHDFVLFDGGIKKLCRPHQYFGIKAAQSHVNRYEGGIVWHTQGSGKSLVMVLLAKWILENKPKARVVIITDRDELDKQIETVFHDAGEQSIKRTRSGKDLMEQLGNTLPRILCSLVHKFGKRGVDDFEDFIAELKNSPTKTVGEIFVFVDECHRTQSGKLHKVMKAILQNAVFIGFTGTPLLKQDRQTSLEVFGKYIHTYKFNEAVIDEVVRDLVYEARDIDQKITAQSKIDKWFEAKTKGLNDFQKSELKKKWGTMQQVLSSRSRLEKIVSDIVFDFNVKPRLASGRGNAILVAGSIYEACKYYELFQNTPLKGKCAIVTSYNPSLNDITTANTGANTETEKEFIYKTYIALLNNMAAEQYEDWAKDKFKKEPANMRLLIVVDKLLTGFDSPPCTYLYIDKKMQDHGLFQAICRVNRLHTDDKQFGYIVDYMDLFPKVENAVSVYTTELDYDTFEKKDVDIMLKDRLEKGREKLDEALERLEALCEPVAPPKDSKAYIRFFCGNPENRDELKETETLRTTLYKYTVSFVRAFANISAELEEAGYSAARIEIIKSKVQFYLNLREEIRMASGETLDMKTYEADMRYLIDNFIQAEESKRIDPFGDQPLLDIIVNSGIAAAVSSLPNGIKSNHEAVAETIENNVRAKIVKEHLIDPAYFDEMSRLLDEIIKERKANALEYAEYLAKIAALANRVNQLTRDDLPPTVKTGAQRAIFNNMNKNEALALSLDEAVLRVKKSDWRGNLQKENEIKAELFKILNDAKEVERIFAVIRQQKEY
jgi:type I restriction enzyme R subunit